MASSEREAIYEYVDKRFDDFVADLTEYVSVPTISPQGKAFDEGAAAVVRLFAKYGIEARRLPTPGGPDVVLGNATAGPGRKTLAMYDHYDVMPVDPLDEWKSDPFKAEVREGAMYGRAVADIKGMLVAQLLAQAAIRETMGKLPLNLRFVIDGEEEVGSPHLRPFADAHPEVFRADAATIEGCDHDAKGLPLFCMGSKGILGLEVRVRTAAVDQHSSMATVIPNAAWRLIAALNALRDEKGRILIKGFRDGARKPTKEELAYLRRNTWDPKDWGKAFGTAILGGKTRFERLKAHVYGNTCTIDGIWSGYTGKGHKTVNPAVAHAKLDFRLLPGQRPADIHKKLLAHWRAKGFRDLEVETSTMFEPAATLVTSPASRAAVAAVKEVYGREPNMLPWMAGSSTTWYFTREGTPAVMPPSPAWAGSRIHAPNEHIRLEDARKAIKAMAAMMLNLAAKSV